MSSPLTAVMKYDRPFADEANVGDAMQSLGALRVMGGADVYLDREGLHDILAPRDVLLVAAGNFSEELPLGWGPRPPVKPLYIGTRFSPHLMTPAFVEHLRAQGPIGARDPATLELLQAHSVDAYFSGCLTLTLEAAPRPRQGVILVDVSDAVLSGLPANLSSDALLVEHVRAPGVGMAVRRLAGGWTEDSPWTARVGPDSGWAGLATIDAVARLPTKVSPLLFPRADRLEDSLRAVHELAHAEALLELYASAELVVTSRLHCALPCLALGTPVVLITPDDAYAPSRYGTFTAFQRRWSDSEVASVDWSPLPPDMGPHARWLRGVLRDRMGELGAPARTGGAEPGAVPAPIHLAPAKEAESAAGSAPLRNKLRNPLFDDWSRDDSPIVFAGPTPAAEDWRYFLHSRGVLADQSRRTFKLGQVDVPGAPRHYARIQVRQAEGVAEIDLLQRMDELELLAGQTGTFSAYLRASRPCEARPFLLRNFGDGGDTAYYDVANQPFQTLDATWRRLAWRFDCRSLRGCSAGLGAHADLTLRIRISVPDTIVDLACPQLEVGASTTSFDASVRDLSRLLKR